MHKRTTVFGTGCDEHQRRRLRDDGEDLGHHRLANLIDPMHVLEDVDRRFGLRQRGRVDERGQPMALRLRVTQRDGILDQPTIR
jgi:hypothetical protein